MTRVTDQETIQPQPSNDELPSNELLPSDISYFSPLAPIAVELAESVAFITGQKAKLGPFNLRAGQEHARLMEQRLASTVRWDKPVLKARDKVIRTFAGMLSEHLPLENEEEFVSGYFNDRIRGVAQESAELSMLSLRILATAEVQRQLREITANTIGKLKPEEPGQRYQVMKALADPTSNSEINPYEQALTALQFFHVFNILDGQHITKALPVEKWLTGGEFDRFIAQDLLRQTVLPNENGDWSGPMELQKLIRQVQLFKEDANLDEIIHMLTADVSLANWTKGPKELLDKQKTNYKLSLAKVREEITAILLENECVMPPATQDDVDLAVKELVEKIARQKKFNTCISTDQRILGRVLLDAANKDSRARAGLNSKANGGHRPGAAESRQRHELRPLVFHKSNRETAEEASLEYNSYLDNFVKSHGGSQLLRDDVEVFLDFLKSVDLSSGPHKGFAVLKNPDPFNYAVTYTNILHIVNFRQAGVVAKSNIGKKTRAIVSLEEDVKKPIGLVSIVTAEEIQQILQAR